MNDQIPDEWLYPQSEETAGAEADKKTKQRWKKPLVITASALLCLLLIACGVYIFLYQEAVSDAQNGEFSKANSLLILRFVTERHDARLLSLVDAGLLLEDGQYAGAETAFAALGDYRGADTMCRETYYRWANACLDQGEYLASYNLFQKISGYRDTDNIVNAQIPLLYASGQAHYRKGDYFSAYMLFHRAAPFEDSDSYLLLIALHLYHYLPDSEVSTLIGLIGFEDAAELLVSDYWLAQYYLLGAWYTDDGSHYFKMDENGGVGSNLPQSASGDFGFIGGGIYAVYNETSSGDGDTYFTATDDSAYPVYNDLSIQGTDVFRFTPLTPDSMEVYCYENDAAYTLYRS